MANQYPYGGGYNGNNAPEYNVNGDSANGLQGSYTPAAQANRQQQQTPNTGNNPYAAILSYVQKPQAAYRAPASQALNQMDNPDTGYGGGSGGAGGGGSAMDTGGQTPFKHPNPLTPPWGSNGATGGIDSLGTGMTAANTNTTVQKPAGIDDGLWADAQRYVANAKAQGQDYSFLLQHPEWISDFRNWALNTPGGTNVDIVDWLKHTHPEVASGLAGRSATGDTYQNWTTNQPAPTPAAAPNPNANPTPYYAPPNDADLMGILHQQYDPLNQQAQQQLSDRLAGQAALTGDLNSGGYGDVLGRQEGNLIANQSADLGDKFLKSRESALDRALGRYGVDSKYLTDSNAQTVEKYIADNNYNAALAALGLDKYKFDNPGINDILAWYMKMSPEQLTAAGLGQIPWPNQVFTHN